MNNGQSYSRGINYVIALFMVVSVGRIHELFPVLMDFPIGKITLLSALLASLTVTNKLDNKKFYRAITKRFIIYMVLCYFSVFLSVWKSQSFEMLKGPVFSIIVLYYILNKSIQTFWHVKFYIHTLIVCAVVLALATISLNASGRLSVGETFDPNDLAMFLVTILPFIVVSIFNVCNWKKILLLAAVSVLILAIILTGSRGGFLGLIAVGGYFVITKIPNIKKLNMSKFSIKKIFLLFIVGVVLVVFAPGSYWDRISTIFNPEQDYNMTSSRGRIAIWEEGIKMIMDHPLGVGIAAFPAAQGMLYGGYYQTAHNTLILVTAELGLLGLWAFLSLYHAAFASLKLVVHDRTNICDELLPYKTAMKGSLLGFFVTSFFLSQAYSALFFALLAITQGMSKICQKSMQERE